MRSFGTAEQTNERYKFLIDHGNTGLSVAFSLHTIYGIEATDQKALGEIGKEGVAIDSLKDMEKLFVGNIFGPFNHQVFFNHIQQGKDSLLPEITLVSHYNAVPSQDLVAYQSRSGPIAGSAVSDNWKVVARPPAISDPGGY